MALTDTALQKRQSPYQKYHLAKMASNENNGISHECHLTITLLVFWSTTNTLLIEPTPTIRHMRVIEISLWNRKNSALKSHDHESELNNKFKHLISEITQLSRPCQITFGHLFELHKIVPFLQGTVFCGYHICLLQVAYLSYAVFVRCHYFQIALKCAIFVMCIWWLSNCNYLLF